MIIEKLKDEFYAKINKEVIIICRINNGLGHFRCAVIN